MSVPRAWSRALVCLLAALVGCGPSTGTTPPGGGDGSRASGSRSSVPTVPADFAPWLEDVAAARGLRFEHVSGHAGPYLMPEIMGGGGALLDVDDDGWLDAYLVQGGHLGQAAETVEPPNQLFINRGDGSFDDVTAGSGADDRSYGMGVACGDVDSDGDVDLYVTNVGPDRLLLNDGQGHFRDGSDAAGLGQPGWGTSAAFFDMDGDGQLDIYVANYLGWTAAGELSCRNFMGQPDYCNPANYDSPARDVLYRGLGAGRFADVSEAAGMRLAATGLGVGCADFDDDGDLDVFVANDGMPDMLWRNEGDGTFTDVAQLAGCALDHSGQAKAGMGVALADVDDDLDVDLLVCNLDKQSDSLFLNDAGLFSDATARSALAVTSRPYTRFGVTLTDLDLDGRLDLFQANGRVGRQSTTWSADPYAEPNLLQRGRDDGRFLSLPSPDGTAAPAIATSRGLAVGDVDNDGAPDLLVVNKDAAAQLLHNLAPAGDAGHHWIGLDVRDEHGRPALGASVLLSIGERRLRRDVRAAASYLSSHDPRLAVGLGAEAAAVSIEVHWPDGARESWSDLAADAWHLVRRGEGR